MDLTQEQKIELFDLFAMLREGAINPEQFKRLDAWLADSREARQAYLDYFKMCGCLRAFQLAAYNADSKGVPAALLSNIDKLVCQDISDSMLWKMMAETERTADTITLIQETKAPEPPVIRIPVENRKINKVSLITFLTATAALMLMFLYVYLNPRVDMEIATLTDSVDARWSEVPFDTTSGSRFATNKGPMRLDQGVVSFSYDQGVNVVIEGPARFEMTTPAEIVLKQGRLYAYVTETGAGFSVKTSNSKVIDLGTEFGVACDDQGDTQLHVFRGKTKLIAGFNNVNEVVDVFGGHARQVSQADKRIETIELNQGSFARSIDPQTRSVWRGESVDLADIVGGGDGVGAGLQYQGIDWNGQRLLFDQAATAEPLKIGSAIAVQDNPFVDCIFVPSGTGQASVTLSSDTTELNMDEFLSGDTNGLITLMLTCESSDEAHSFWFYSKEGAGQNSDFMPALIFPQAAGGSAVITTADAQGADTYVSNDDNQSGKTVHGDSEWMNVRHFKGVRSKLVFLRFDISAVSGSRQGAVLRLYLVRGTRTRNLQIYGLKDGPSDTWDENKVCYNTAPGLLEASAGEYKLDMEQVELLGSCMAVDTSIRISRDNRKMWVAPEDSPIYSFSNSRPQYPIIAGGKIGDAQNGMLQSNTFMMGSIRCPTSDNPCIFLAANGGITFDLAAIRARYSMKPTSFKAVCGLARRISASVISDTAAVPKANCYVLVDGTEVFSSLDQSTQDRPQSIQVHLTGGERYLTLVTTQGSDGDNQNDLCVFLRPVLQLEP